MCNDLLIRMFRLCYSRPNLPAPGWLAIEMVVSLSVCCHSHVSVYSFVYNYMWRIYTPSIISATPVTRCFGVPLVF